MRGFVLGVHSIVCLQIRCSAWFHIFNTMLLILIGPLHPTRQTEYVAFLRIIWSADGMLVTVLNSERNKMTQLDNLL